MRDSRLVGIVDFPESLLVTPDVLGCSVQISINGEMGRLHAPRPPASFPASGRRPNIIELSTPRGGRREWLWGDKPKQWGQVVDTKTGRATIDAVVIDFGAFGDDGGLRAQSIHDGFGSWHKRFFEFVKLISKQGTSNASKGGDSPGRIEMLQDDRGPAAHVSVRSHTVLTFYVPDMNKALCAHDFRRVARTASAGRHMKLEYLLLLEAYYARRAGDYRSAVLQAGTAVEVALVSAIRRGCKLNGIAFGDKLISKYNALGGKFELAKLLDIDVRATDYIEKILQPRNRVAHQGHFPSRADANGMIACVESIFGAIAPDIVEAPGDV